MVSLHFFFAAAVLGGLVGTLAMTVFWYAARSAGWMTLDWGQLLGTFFYPPGKRALATGLTWHFATGLIFGLVYAFALSFVGIAPGVMSGLMLGVIHAFVALGMLFFLPRVHPALPDDRATHLWDRRDLALYAAGFPLFGAVFGGTYAYYDTWVSSSGTDPARFWLAAFGTIAIAVVIGIATYQLVPREREETGPIFASASLSVAEQRAAVTSLYEQGDLTEEEYRTEMEALDEEEKTEGGSQGV
jgi:hypothetical protein